MIDEERLFGGMSLEWILKLRNLDEAVLPLVSLSCLNSTGVAKHKCNVTATPRVKLPSKFLVKHGSCLLLFTLPLRTQCHPASS